MFAAWPLTAWKSRRRKCYTLPDGRWGDGERMDIFTADGEHVAQARVRVLADGSAEVYADVAF
jgi:hypothetical protein